MLYEKKNNIYHISPNSQINIAIDNSQNYNMEDPGSATIYNAAYPRWFLLRVVSLVLRIGSALFYCGTSWSFHIVTMKFWFLRTVALRKHAHAIYCDISRM